MSKRGTYLGGHTTIGPRSGWFTKVGAKRLTQKEKAAIHEEIKVARKQPPGPKTHTKKQKLPGTRHGACIAAPGKAVDERQIQVLVRTVHKPILVWFPHH